MAWRLPLTEVAARRRSDAIDDLSRAWHRLREGDRAAAARLLETALEALDPSWRETRPW